MISRELLQRMLAEGFLLDLEEQLAKACLEALDEVARLRKSIKLIRDTLQAADDNDWFAAFAAVKGLIETW